MLFNVVHYGVKPKRKRLFVQQHASVGYHLWILAYVHHLVHTRLLKVDVQIDSRWQCFCKVCTGAERCCRRHLQTKAQRISLTPITHVTVVTPRLIGYIRTLCVSNIIFILPHKLPSYHSVKQGAQPFHRWALPFAQPSLRLPH